jgi:hypothetical protein
MKWAAAGVFGCGPPRCIEQHLWNGAKDRGRIGERLAATAVGLVAMRRLLSGVFLTEPSD